MTSSPSCTTVAPVTLRPCADVVGLAACSCLLRNNMVWSDLAVPRIQAPDTVTQVPGKRYRHIPSLMTFAEIMLEKAPCPSDSRLRTATFSPRILPQLLPPRNYSSVQPELIERDFSLQSPLRLLLLLRRESNPEFESHPLASLPEVRTQTDAAPTRAHIPPSSGQSRPSVLSPGPERQASESRRPRAIPADE